MPIIRAAKKSLRSSVRKRVFNDKRRKEMRLQIKKITELAKNEKFDEAKKLLPKVYKAVDKARKRGIIKKNTASRKKSRLAKMIQS